MKPDTFVVPRGWGREVIDESMAMVALLGGRAEAEARGRINQHLRSILERKSITVREVAPGYRGPLQANEVTDTGHLDEDRLFSELPRVAPSIRQIKTQDLADFDRQPVFPVVAYMTGQSGGKGKYLLDTPQQYQRLKQFFARDGQTQALARSFRFKRFIPTPSNRFTSYRIIATAYGHVLFGGLLYSEAMKTQHARITSGVAVERLGLVGSSYLDYLEVPQSPYYLHARQFTSNVAGGGGCIPLNPTVRSRRINSTEQEILAAHGILDQRIPPVLATSAASIARFLGPHISVVFALDFIQDPQGIPYLLEANTGPGVQTVNEIENYGHEDTATGYRLLMERVLTAVFCL